ncbi:MAG: folate biosynthesis protein [Thermoleophilia bacterium]|jgi:dihydroneopterin aldolase|nr:folate biosynthesis protein [Thermoleophilia bacterium]
MSAVAPVAPVTVKLDGLSVYAHHGMVAEERSLGQRFSFDLEVDIPDCVACRTDEAGDAVAYEALAAVVVEVATNFRFSLMEALADAVCMELLAEFPISRVRLAVSKTAPSIPHSVARATVVLERTRAHLEGSSS